jgi:type I restriction enzyme, S subunit
MLGPNVEASESVRLGRCFSSVDYGTGQASKSTGAIAVLGMGNLDDDGRVGGEPAGYVDEVEANLLLGGGELLFNRTNSREKVGKVGIVQELSEPTTFASYLVRLTPTAIASASFLNHLLNCDEVLGVARAAALPSIGQANLNPSRYSEMRIVLPSLGEQGAIVNLLDRDWEIARRTEQLLSRQVALLREHRQALITAAVTGESDNAGVA